MDPARDYTADLPRKRMAAGLLVTNDTGQALLVEPTYKDYWEIPGGAVEADESPRSAVVREIHEELGLTARITRLLVVDWVPPLADRTEGLMFVFAGTLPAGAEVVLPPDELRSWNWVGADEADALLSPRLARRLRAALAADRTGRTLYLEDGVATEA